MDTELSFVKSEISFFKEHIECISVIKNFCESDWEQHYNEKREWLNITMIKYLEQPSLLNPYLEDLVTPLSETMLRIVSSVTISEESKNHLQRFENKHLLVVCQTLQLLCRVRGYKSCVKLFPHEVYQLECAIFILRAQDVSDCGNWETRYILLLWLSILCLMPFDICSMDSSLHSSSRTDSSPGSITAGKVDGCTDIVARSKLVSSIVFLSREFLSETGPVREAAATCLAALLTRPDMDEDVLAEFITWACDLIDMWARRGNVDNEISLTYFQLLGTLQCLSQIFKKGHRNNLLGNAAMTLGPCLRLFSQENQTIVRKLATKLLQRLGTTFLPPKVAKWRYKRGCRSLLVNLQTTKPISTSVNGASAPLLETKIDDDDDDDLCDVPSEMEEIVDQLLKSLQDKDTVVRWSAAKGIGRVTMSLPKSFVDDVVAAIFIMFQDADSDSAWHGGCLSLAELCRRGLLMPEQLGLVVPVVARAIHFDVLRGQHSVGIHVRDAACYVCWAFARAYSPLIMQPFVKDLSRAMLLTALFDREINCRRAASAAFQENVGRQGHENFPKGIDIISLADFFSLSSRSAAYLKVAPLVAALDDSLHASMESHLRQVKLSHWDIDVRDLAAKSLGKLTTINPSRLIAGISDLVSDILCQNANRRHGIILAIAEILLALRVNVIERIGGVAVELPGPLSDEIQLIVQKLDKARLYRGKGGEILRYASCYLVECLARAQIRMPLKNKISLIEALNENLKQPHEKVQKAAVKALRQALFCFFALVEEVSDKLKKITVTLYLDWILKAENVAYTRSGTLALGVLPLPLLCGGGDGQGRLTAILSALEDSAHVGALVAGDPDAETRRNAVNALIEIGNRLLLLHSRDSKTSCGPESLCDPQLNATLALRRVLVVLQRSCEDYSIDKRGDIGSWIRTAAMRGLVGLVLAILRTPKAGDGFGPFPTDFRRTKFTRFGLIEYSTSPVDYPLKGWHVQTSYGLGVISDVIDGNIVSVDFPVESLAAMEGTVDNYSCEQKNLEEVSMMFRLDTVRKLEPPLPFVMPFHLGSFQERLRIVDNATFQIFPTRREDSVWADLFDQNLCKTIVCILLKQLGEKLDWVRSEAGSALSRLVTCKDPIVPCILNRFALETLVGAESSAVSWSNPSTVFPRLIQFLKPDAVSNRSNEAYSAYFYSTLSGLVVSVGGLSESVVKGSSEAILHWCRDRASSNDYNALSSLASALLDLLSANEKLDRVVVPTLRTVDLLLRNDYFKFLFEVGPDGMFPNFGTGLSDCILRQLRGSEISKLYVCVDMLALISASGGPSRKPSFYALVGLLGHKFPKMRKYAAEQLYVHLVSDPCAFCDQASSEVSSNVFYLAHSRESFEKAQEIILGTVWDAAPTIVRPPFNLLRDILNVPVPVKQAKVSPPLASDSQSHTVKNKVVSDELESYEALVKDAGY